MREWAGWGQGSPTTRTGLLLWCWLILTQGRGPKSCPHSAAAEVFCKRKSSHGLGAPGPQNPACSRRGDCD